MSRSPGVCFTAWCERQGQQANGSELAGADLERAEVAGADFYNADVTSTRLIGLRGREKACNLDRAKNLDRAFRD